MTDEERPDLSRISAIGRELAECVAQMEANREPEPFSLRRTLANLRRKLKLPARH